MLSGGLSFYAFFTVVPAILIFVSALGFIIDDPTERESLITDLIGQIDVEDYDNRIVAAGTQLPRASSVRAAVRASPVLSASLDRLRLRTVQAPSQPSRKRPRRRPAARPG